MKKAVERLLFLCKNHFFCIFLELRTCSVLLLTYLCARFQKTTIMEKNVLSLVMDTVGIICVFFIAAVLLCV